MLAAGQAKVAVKFTRKAKRKLGSVKSLPVSVAVVFTDAAGAKTRKTTKVTLKR